MDSITPVHSRPQRLVLFDIDGTLLSSAGVAAGVFAGALAAAVGRPVPMDGYSMAGRTDRQIARELLTRAGVPPESLDRLIDQVLVCYLERFAPALAASTGPRLFPGVRALIERLAADPEVLLGLLTGNLERGAAIKLAHFGIHHHFRLGAYGSDAEERRALVAIAAARARTLTGQDFSGRDIVVIGDTPLDIDCGKAAGATTIAVATGPYPVAELAAHEPDVLFTDFAEPDAVVTAIRGAPAGEETR
jgi:phosphoglycolate phosphatase-like HAD superfamily hydrolase